EALETVIFGLDLKAGDEILTTNQDYPNMMNAWNQRVKRDGLKLTTISIPVPPKDLSEIVDAYRKAITPKTKIIHVSHVIFMTGQIMPVREIADMAHEKGIEVICDGAHSFAHLDYKISDLHCDYFGTSLHKWLCAPFGSGLLYVKKEKIEKLWPLLGAPKDFSTTDIRKFEHLGTRSFPIELAIGNSIDFHNGIGSKRKEERLRYLKNYWAEKVGRFPKVKFNTSLMDNQSCAICNFTIEGMEPAKIHEELFSKYKIYTTTITHDEFKGVRITPHVYTKIKDLDFFVSAVEKIAKG
ncbi:MAG: aminotransferase class V-fold PLP-dependent enzyme, partial [Bacteroidota bacterium]